MLTALSACSGGANGQAHSAQSPKRPTAPVTIATAQEKEVPVQLTAIGTVEAVSTISVKAQIGGVLTKVHFAEGEDVHKGDLLFTIDPKPYEVALKQAQADLAGTIAQKRQAEANQAKDSAQAANAQVEANRLESLIHQGAVARDQYDKAQTELKVLQATVQADKAAIQSAEQAIQGAREAVESARISLNYCTLRTPIAGRTGSLLVHQGNLIKANADDPMVVINQLAPIHVSFAIPEQYLSEVKRFMAQDKLEVRATIPHEEKSPAVGELTFIDNLVDRGTGTIKLKGSFENKDHRLWPGQFVDVKLRLTVQARSVVVPTQAVQTGQDGQYVFVVKPDLTVESRSVTTGEEHEDEVVIDKGLKGGEKVVTDGQLRLAPGATVEIKQSLEDGKPGAQDMQS